MEGQYLWSLLMVGWYAGGEQADRSSSFMDIIKWWRHICISILRRPFTIRSSSLLLTTLQLLDSLMPITIPEGPNFPFLWGHSFAQGYFVPYFLVHSIIWSVHGWYRDKNSPSPNQQSLVLFVRVEDLQKLQWTWSIPQITCRIPMYQQESQGVLNFSEAFPVLWSRTQCTPGPSISPLESEFISPPPFFSSYTNSTQSPIYFFLCSVDPTRTMKSITIESQIHQRKSISCAGLAAAKIPRDSREAAVLTSVRHLDSLSI